MQSNTDVAPWCYIWRYQAPNRTNFLQLTEDCTFHSSNESCICILSSGYCSSRFALAYSWGNQSQGYEPCLQKKKEFQNGRTAIIDTFLIPSGGVAALCFCHSFVSPLCLGTIGASCPAAPLPVRCVTLFFHVLPLHKWLFYPSTFVFKHWTLIVQSWV